MNVLDKLSLWLFEPSTKIQQEDERSQAKLLSTLLFFVLLLNLLFIIGITILWQKGDLSSQFYAGLANAAIVFTAYLLSRTRWYETAVFLLAIGFAWNIILTLQAAPEKPIFLIFFILPVMLSSMVISIKQTAVIALIEFIAILYLLITYQTASGFWEDGIMIVSLYVVFVGLILLSMSHQKKIEQIKREQFIQQEIRLQTYFDNATDWLFALDKQGLISSVNQAVQNSLGYSAEEIIGQSPAFFLSEEQKDSFQNILDGLNQGEKIRYLEVVVKSKNGRSIWLEIHGHRLYENYQAISTFHIGRDITDRKIAEEARKKLNREIKVIYETGHRLGQKIDLKTVYTTIYDSIISVIDFNTFIVSSYNYETQEVTVEFVRYFGKALDASQFPKLQLTDSRIGVQREVILTGESKLINNYFEEIGKVQYLHYWDGESKKEVIANNFTQSAILVPLKIDGQVQGILEIHSDQINAFNQDNLYFLEALSSHIISAITNANLLKQSQNELLERKKAEKEARKGQAIAEALQISIAILNSSLSLEDVLQQILVQLQDAISFDSAAIQQKKEDLLILRAARGFDDDTALIGLSFKIESNLPNVEVIRSQKPLSLQNVSEVYPEFNDIASIYQADKIYSWLGLPLLAEGEVLGMITIDRNEIKPFTPDEILLATTFANHAAIAFHNAALYRELETHSETLEKAVIKRTNQLQRTTDQVKAILNNSPDAILFLNADQTIKEWNPAFIQLFEYKPDEVLGMPFLNLIIEAEHEAIQHILNTVVSSNSTLRFDTTLINKNGRFIEANAAVAPTQENNIHTGIVCNLHDISHFKEVERLKDTFVSNVSHELRTPITNLRLHHDLLHINPKKHDVYIARLGREINRLNIIIEDLLRISRLDQKRVEINYTEVNLVGLTEQYLNDRNVLAENKSLQLSLSIECDIPIIQADPRLLEQVIGILLTNAMNYTPPGGVIQLTPLHKLENKHEWVGLRISDTGPGIPQSEHSQIFTRFFRGQAAQDSGEPGTGLGLAIAQEIMHLHQGFIELEKSSAEEGTSFVIWLPAANY